MIVIDTVSMQRPEISDGALCEICLERIAAHRCCRCSFVLCGPCKETFHKNIATSQLLDQCGQCKKEHPWINKLFVSRQSVDAVVDGDVENQQEDRIYKPFISPEVAMNMRRYAGDFLLCFGTFLVAESIGFLFLLLRGESDMMKSSTLKGNEHFILLILLICGFIGMLIIIALLVVLIPCAFCIGAGIIVIIDQH